MRINRRWVVASASGGTYSPSCFQMEKGEIGVPGDGEVLVDTRLFSLDPTHLNWIKLDPQLQFLPIAAGDPMIGTNIGIVMQSRCANFAVGQIVMGTWGWEEIAIAQAALLKPALPESRMPFAEQLAILSHVGHAAAGGMIAVANAQPGEAVLISAAAGATGSIAAQIAKAQGCTVIGMAGSADKCRYLIDELGLDGAIDYKSEDMESALARHFPNGIDVFFDNVGGATLEAVLAHMARGCRIAACGAIAQYDQGAECFAGITRLPLLIFRQAKIEGFVAGQFGDDVNAELTRELLALYESGQLKVRTQIVDFEAMPDALSLLLSGRNSGKLIAQVA